MTHVVTEACICCRYTDCVSVCPVDAFHGGPNMLAINPSQCIDCSLCIPVCPIKAIYSEEELPDHLKPFKKLNEQLTAKWPIITQHEAALPNADVWRERKNKLEQLQHEFTNPGD